MKVLKIVGIAVGGLVAILLLLGSLLPKGFKVERSIEIGAPPAEVFAQVNSLKKWDAWSPWIAKDKTISNVFSGPEAGVGAKVSWTSDDSGAGTQVITLSEAPSRIESDLDFGDQGRSKAYWSFVPSPAGTTVTWGLKGDMPGPIGGLMATQMDSWVGKDYEDGLARLKRVAEGS